MATHEYQEFSRAWVARRNELRPPQPLLQEKGAGKGKGKGKGRGKGGTVGAEPPPRTVPAGQLAQSEVAPLNPPGGTIWRANKVESWCSHFPPFVRFSAPWAQ